MQYNINLGPDNYHEYAWQIKDNVTQTCDWNDYEQF